MKTTVLIFLQTSDVTPAGQPLSVAINKTAQELAVSEVQKTRSGADRSMIHKASNPPLWTWFVENPRPEARNVFRRPAF